MKTTKSGNIPVAGSGEEVLRESGGVAEERRKPARGVDTADPASRVRRVAFDTLGCRLNQLETDAVATQFRRAGYAIVPFAAEADAYIVNTCTVTDRSDRKSRNAINRATSRGLKPIVVATGCYVQSNLANLRGRDGLSYVVGNDRKSSIFNVVDAHFRGEIVDLDSFPADRFSFVDGGDGFHTRRSVKVQDGCDNFCTFCIIPHVRGRAESRPLSEILGNVRLLVENGAREVVLTGVNIGRYHYEGCTFTDLIREVLRLQGDFRVRISSMEPDILGEGFIDLFDDVKLCPHLHLCLQSASERILLAMRRQYTYASYRALVERIRLRHPDFNFTTDIMVGFPGETEEEFAQTCAAVEEIGFSHLHVFPYSKREGTRAQRMAGQIPAHVKSERVAHLRSLSEQGKRRYRSGFVGREELVLVERVRRGVLTGYGRHYVPVEFGSEGGSDPESPVNRFQRVRITSIGTGSDPVLTGKPM